LNGYRKKFETIEKEFKNVRYIKNSLLKSILNKKYGTGTEL
jgi:hypothetical protein